MLTTTLALLARSPRRLSVRLDVAVTSNFCESVLPSVVRYCTTRVVGAVTEAPSVIVFLATSAVKSVTRRNATADTSAASTGSAVSVRVPEPSGPANVSVRVPASKTILPSASWVPAKAMVSTVPESPLSFVPSMMSWSTAPSLSLWRWSSVRVNGSTRLRLTWMSAGRESPVDRYAMWLPWRFVKMSLGAPAAPGRSLAGTVVRLATIADRKAVSRVEFSGPPCPRGIPTASSENAGPPTCRIRMNLYCCASPTPGSPGISYERM